jgi:hydroxyacylglutathione hydrolase
MSIHSTHLNVRPVRAFADNYIWLIESPASPDQVVAVDPGRCRSGDRRVAAQRRKLSRDFTHSPSSRSYRRCPRPAAPGEGARDRTGRCANCAAHPHRARWRALRFAELGTFLRDFASARAYVKPHCLLGARRAVLRRHAVQRGLRPNVRGYAYANECFIEQTARLAAGTRVFCGHEYTAANLRFALTVEPGQCRRARIPGRRAARARGGQSLAALDPGPGDRVNPFLRCDNPP